MSLNPFRADPEIAARHADLVERLGGALADDIARRLFTARGDPDANLGGVLQAADAAALIETHGLGSVDMLMLLALTPARAFARPPISGFFVGAVGRERETGNLVLGGNMEFPGTHLGFTIHGEGFVLTRAFSRGTSIDLLAIGEAHPCAHCRQYLSEFAATRGMLLIDPLGHRLTMAELYPWPFDPDYLGEAGYVVGAIAHPELVLAGHGLPAPVAERLLCAGRRAHAPYSKCPGAVVLTLADGALVAGSSIESVAFNPTLGPLQAALIDLAAHGRDPAEIAAVALATRRGGAVDYAASVAELLSSLAPAAPLTVIEWDQNTP